VSNSRVIERFIYGRFEGIVMYSDDKQRKEHLVDFKSVLHMIEHQTVSKERDYRIKVLKECINRCSE
jgi:hypothetical protein